MTRMNKTTSKKFPFSNDINKMKNSEMLLKDKIALKKAIIHHLVHPDYILFDWEFFSNQLEFE
jgi:hypothetical protein